MGTVRVNGKPASHIDLLDRGFQYGDGVFTTFLLHKGVPLFLEQHLERLHRDCGRLAIPPVESAILRREVQAIVGDELEGVIKIQITRGVGGRGYRVPVTVNPTTVIALHPPPGYPDQYPIEGIQVRYCQTRLGINPVLAGIKHINRLEQVLARSEWSNDEIAEGLMLDHEGQLVEGTMSNVFLVRHGRLLTPQLDRCGVCGVMRSVLLSAAKTQGLSFDECRLTVSDIENADEAFVTNSIIGLWPIAGVEGKFLPVGPVTRKLREWLNQAIEQQTQAS